MGLKAMRQLTLAQFKAVAAEQHERTTSDYLDAVLTKSHFDYCTAGQLIEMWESGRNLRRCKLSDFEFKALCEAWVRVFNSLPPGPTDTASDQADEISRPDPDTMLNMRDVCRLTGLSESSIKRLVTDSRFPAPIKLSLRRNGWLASAVIEWRDTRPA